MHIKEWYPEVVTKQYFTKRITPFLVLHGVLTCPVCGKEFSVRQELELDPWQVQSRKNLGWLAEGVGGYNSGFFCPGCGTSGIVPKQEQEQLKQAVEGRLTPAWFDEVLSQLGCQVGKKTGRGIPPNDYEYETKSFEAPKAGQSVKLDPVPLAS